MRDLVLREKDLTNVSGILNNFRQTGQYHFRAQCPVCRNDTLALRLDGRRLHVRCYDNPHACTGTRIDCAMQELGFDLSEIPVPGTPEIPAVKADAFLAEVGPLPPAIVEDLIPDHTLLLLTGKSKFAKSLLAVDMLDCICQGKPVFGSLTVHKPGPVLYLAMEDGNYQVADRLRRRGLTDARDFYLCTQRRVVSTDLGIASLTATTKRIKPVVVLIDTAREALDIRDWSNPAEISNRLRPLRQYTREFATVILVAHNRKLDGDDGDEISGSNAVTSSVDGWLSCYRKDVLPNGDLCLRIRREGRDSPHREFTVRMNTQDLHFSFPSANLPEQDPEQERLCSILRRILENDAPITAPWLGAQLGTQSRTTQRILNDLMHRGWLEDTGERTGRTGVTVVYRLTDSGKCECDKTSAPPVS